jgi:16S rRNA (guanine527-N7)-methyltransferase
MNLDKMLIPLHDCLDRSGYSSDPEVDLTVLIEHLLYVMERNKQINLTSISTFEEGLLLHLEDSLEGLLEIQRAPVGKLADMGSGAGFPGIPLALITRRNTFLIESISKKARVLREFIETHSLSSCLQVSNTRIEEHSRVNAGQYAVVVARALASQPVLLELASPLLLDNGLLISYKGPLSDEELEQGRSVAPLVGMLEEQIRRFQLSDQKTKRTILCYRKMSPSTIELPRRTGLAQNRPLTGNQIKTTCNL